jgi:hypothetical protein
MMIQRGSEQQSVDLGIRGINLTVGEFSKEEDMKFEGHGRKRCGIEEFGLIGIASGIQFSAEDFTGETDNHDITVETAEDAAGVDQVAGPAEEAGFFADFAGEGFGDGFAGFDEAAGETPPAQAGLDISLDEQKAAFPKQNGRDRGCWVEINDTSAVFAHGTRASVTFLQTQSATAMRTESRLMIHGQ